MFKKIIIGVFVIIVFIAASVYIFRANIKRYALQTILKSFPLPNVALADVNFDEAEGRLSLEDIRVKTPRGFSRDIFSAKKVDMKIGIVTQPELLLDIDAIDLWEPVITLERSPQDTWNFDEYLKKKKSASGKEISPGFIREAQAKETEKSRIMLPRSVEITDGRLVINDNFVKTGSSYTISLFPLNGKVLLDYGPDNMAYEKINLNAISNVNGMASSTVKTNLDLFPAGDKMAYSLDMNALDIPLETLKPYLDRYTPFIVKEGRFNMTSQIRTVGGTVKGDHTMELMDLVFAVNPRKADSPFLETSVKKMTMYLTNQRGNVVIDFRQRGDLDGKMDWSLGPIAKRAIGLLVIDTVIDVINAIDKGTGARGKASGLPNDVPPEVIEIFKGIFD